jgi:hypothetical protein
MEEEEISKPLQQRDGTIGKASKGDPRRRIILED